MSFHVGQLVVCVDDAAHPEWPGIHRPCGLRRGHVYTVRDANLRRHGRDCIRLVEIFRPPLGSDESEPPFYEVRFRPIDDTKLAIFRKLLTDIPREVEQA